MRNDSNRFLYLKAALAGAAVFAALFFLAGSVTRYVERARSSSNFSRYGTGSKDADPERVIQTYEKTVESKRPASPERSEPPRGPAAAKRRERAEEEDKVVNRKLARTFFERAGESVSRRQYDSAIQDLTKAIELDDGNTDAYLLRARAYLRTGDFSGTVADCDTVIRREPDNAAAHYYRAVAYQRFDNDMFGDVALDDYDRAVELAPREPDYRYSRGRLLDRRGKLSAAMADYTKTVELNPRHLGAWYWRASGHYCMGRMEQAIADYTKVIELNPRHFSAHYYRAYARYRTGDYRGALEDYSAAIARHPRHAPAYYFRSQVYHHLEDFERSLKDYKRYEELSPYRRGRIPADPFPR